MCRHFVRSARCWLTLTLISLIAGCAKDPMRPDPEAPSPPLVASIDNYPTWSHDGRWVAYQRRYMSTDGPPGAYIIPAGGGAAQFLVPGDFVFPIALTFSPDDR